MFAGSSDRRAEAQPVNYQAVARFKESKKGLISGLSLGGVLLAVILAAGLIFVFGLKGGSKGNDGSINLDIPQLFTMTSIHIF